MSGDPPVRHGGPPAADDQPVAVRARLFAMQRQQTGLREVQLRLPAGATVGGAWEALVALFPGLESAGPTIRFARNGVYSDPSEPLADGDEVAFIPPVAGGAPDAGEASGATGERRRRIELHEMPLDAALVARLEQEVAAPEDGAVVVFVGRTRETPGTPAPGQEVEAARHAGTPVVALDYEAYEAMAVAVLGTIADEIEDRFGVRRMAIVHRTGEVPLGDASVVIATAAPHRAAAFEACRYAIEELKARAPIWKAERFADGSVWLGAPARTGAAPDSARSPDRRDVL